MGETIAEYVARLAKRDRAILNGAMSGFQWQNKEHLMNLENSNTMAKETINLISKHLNKEDRVFYRTTLLEMEKYRVELETKLNVISFIDTERDMLFKERGDFWDNAMRNHLKEKKKYIENLMDF